MLWAGKVVALSLTHPSSFALRTACVVTTQSESRSLSVFKTVYFGVLLVLFFCLVWLVFFPWAWCVAGWVFLWRAGTKGKSKSFFGEKAGSVPVSWIKLCNLVQVRKKKGVLRSKQISIDWRNFNFVLFFFLTLIKIRDFWVLGRLKVILAFWCFPVSCRDEPVTV